MHDRRDVLSLTGAVLLTGCGTRLPRIEVDLDSPVIDAHGHIFNGKDVPVVDFLDQVVLRDPHEMLTDPGLRVALMRLLVFVLRETVLTPREELKQMDPRHEAALGVSGRPDAGDEAAVTRALAKYRVSVSEQSGALGLDGGPSDDARLLNEIYGGATRAVAAPGLDETADEAAARRIYQRKGETYVHRNAIFQ